MSDGKECVFKSRLKRSYSTAASRNESDSGFQIVGRRLRKPGCRMCCDETVEDSVCDGWPNGEDGVGNFGDWHQQSASYRGRPTLELGTEVIDEQYSQRSKVNFDRPYHNLKVTADRLPWHVNIGFKSVIKRYRQFLSVYRHRPLYSGCGSGEK